MKASLLAVSTLIAVLLVACALETRETRDFGGLVLVEADDEPGRLVKRRVWVEGRVDSSRLEVYDYDNSNRIVSKKRFRSSGGIDRAASREYAYEDGIRKILLSDAEGTRVGKLWNVSDRCGLTQYRVRYKMGLPLDTLSHRLAWQGGCSVVKAPGDFASGEHGFKTRLTRGVKENGYWKAYGYQIDSSLQYVVEDYEFSTRTPR